MNEHTTIYRIIRSDLDHLAGRQVTDEEARRITKAIGYSSIPDALAEVVGSVVGEADEEESA